MKRLLILTAGLTAAGVLIVAGMLLFMGDEQYQAVLGWSADRFLGSDLVIDGPFSLGFADGINLTAGDVRLLAHDGSYDMQSAVIKTTFNLSSLLSGVLMIDELSLSGFSLRINETEADGGADLAGLDMPPVVVGRANIDDLVIEFQETEPGTLHRIALDRLVIDDTDGGGLLTVSAAGALEGRPFTIDGVIPPLTAVLDTITAKPVSFTVVSETIKAEINGTIMDPLSGAGMDLAVHARLTGVQELAEIFDDGIPPLGDLEISARVHGDYQVPGLEEIVLHLQRESSVDVHIKGEIANALTGEGVRLQIDGTSEDPRVLSYLLFKREDRLASLRVKGQVRRLQQAYHIDKLDAEAVTTEGLRLSVAGSGRLFGEDHVIKRQDAGFIAKLSAPRTAALNLHGDEALPELGPVSGSGRLAISTAAIGLYEVDIRVGDKGTGSATLKGDMGQVPLKQGGVLEGLALQLDLRANNLAVLGRKLGFKWPALGATRLSGDLGIRGDQYVLDHARLAIGNPEQPTVKASGNVRRQIRKGSTIDIDFDVATADLVAAYSNRTPGYLGRIKGSAVISNLDGSWGARQINLASSQTRLFQLHLDGAYGDLEKHDRIELNTVLSIADPVALGKALGLDIKSIKGPYRAKGRLVGNKGNIRYRGSTTLGRSTSKADISGKIVAGKPHFSGKLEIPVLHLVDLGLDPDAAPPVEASAGKTEESSHQYVFSRKPLDVGFLDDFNLDLEFLVHKVESGELAIESVSAQARINDGRLIVEPLKLKFEGGESDVVFVINNSTPPEYRLKIVSDDVSLGPLMAQLQEDVPINGYSNIQLDLVASGRSQYELASSLNGTAGLGLENARIPQRYIEMLSVDVFGWVLSKSFSREKYADLNCVILAFDVNSGNVTSNTIIADGPRLSLGGKINLDLGAETLDIVIIPKQKRRIFSSITPVKVKGPMRDPQVTAMPAKAAIKEVGGLALLPAVTISVTLIDRLWSIVADGDATGTGCSGIATTDEALTENPVQQEHAD